MLAILESNHAKPTRVCGMGVVSGDRTKCEEVNEAEAGKSGEGVAQFYDASKK